MHPEFDLLGHTLEHRKLLTHGIRKTAQYVEIERQIGDIETHRQGLGTILQRVLFVAAQHQSALIGLAYTFASMMRVIGCVTSTPSMGSVISN